MSARDPRIEALLDDPLVQRLRAAAGTTPCHLVGGLLRDRCLGLASHDYDAVVGAHGREIGQTLARRLPARLVELGGRQFAAYRLVGDGFTLDIWDRQGGPLEADLARRDFTVNAFALDVAGGALADPFGGLADLDRRLLRATGAGVFAADPLRLLRLVRLTVQLPGFSADPASLESARLSAAGIAGIASERVREELRRIFAAPRFATAFELMAALDLYPGLLLGRPGEPGEAGVARDLLARLEGALERLLPPDAEAGGAGARGHRMARLAVLLAALPGADGAERRRSLRRFRDAGYVTAGGASLCERLLACRRVPAGEAAQRWFLHVWGDGWRTAAAMLAVAAQPPLASADWRALCERLQQLAAGHGDEIFSPQPLLDGHQIQRLLGIGPGPGVGAAAKRLRRAQVEGRVRSRAEAETLLRPSSAAG